MGLFRLNEFDMLYTRALERGVAEVMLKATAVCAKWCSLFFTEVYVYVLKFWTFYLAYVNPKSRLFD